MSLLAGGCAALALYAIYYSDDAERGFRLLMWFVIVVMAVAVIADAGGVV